MYSDIHKIIFVHQRKAAGSSVKAMFIDAQSPFNDGVLDPNWCNENYRVKNYYKFSVVRNPWDRFISAWKYLKSTRNRSIEDVLLNLPHENLLKNLIFDNSIQARLAYSKELTSRTFKRFKNKGVNLITNQNLRIPHDTGHDYRHITRQQYLSLYYPNGDLAVDQIIFLEDLERGLSELIKNIQNPEMVKPLLRLNQNRVLDDYRKYFNSKTLEIFNSKFSTDISIWGYKFESGPGVAPIK